MFEKISGLFKRFTKRRPKQSGETTIMDGKEPGLDEFGLDEGFGELGDLEESIDQVGTAPAGLRSDAPFSDADFDTGEADFSTGISDFDEQTISDEVSGPEVIGGPGAPVEAPGAFIEEEEAPPFAEPVAEPEPVSAKKRIVTLAVVAVVAIAMGAVGQYFIFPLVGGFLGAGGAEEPKLDIEAQLNAEQRKNAKLKNEVAEFKKMGQPGQVKALQQQLAQTRDTQGPLTDLEANLGELKESETAYNELSQRISDLESQVAATRGDISNIRSEIDEARLKVVELARQTEEEYKRFQVELVRAERSQRLVIELQMEDLNQLRLRLDEISEYLSSLPPAPPVSVSSAAVARP